MEEEENLVDYEDGDLMTTQMEHVIENEHVIDEEIIQKPEIINTSTSSLVTPKQFTSWKKQPFTTSSLESEPRVKREKIIPVKNRPLLTPTSDNELFSTIFLSSLSPDISAGKLLSHYEKFGEISEFWLDYTHPMRPCYIRFIHPNSARLASKALPTYPPLVSVFQIREENNNARPLASLLFNSIEMKKVGNLNDLITLNIIENHGQSVARPSLTKMTYKAPGVSSSKPLNDDLATQKIKLKVMVEEKNLLHAKKIVSNLSLKLKEAQEMLKNVGKDPESRNLVISQVTSLALEFKTAQTNVTLAENNLTLAKKDLDNLKIIVDVPVNEKE
jgi:hypothetical protein